MPVIGEQACRVPGSFAVDLESFAGCYKPEYVVAGDGFAAICQGILDLIAAFAEDDELGIFLS